MTRPVPSQERSRQRVESIVNATLALLRRGGVEQCTVAAISAEANISPASLYRYFPDSQAVLRAVASSTLEVMHEALRDHIAAIVSADDVAPVLRSSLDMYYQAFVDDRALRELWTGTMADRELVTLNIEDSRRNGILIAQQIGPFIDLPRDELTSRCFLMAHLTGSAVSLMLDLPPAEAAKVREHLQQMMVFALAPAVARTCH